MILMDVKEYHLIIGVFPECVGVPGKIGGAKKIVVIWACF